MGHLWGWHFRLGAPAQRRDSFAINSIFSSGGVPQALAQHQGPPCSLDRLAGDWGFISTGKSAGVDFNSTGTFHLNKDGTSSAHLFANMGSSFLDFERFGITTVNDDCTLTCMIGRWITRPY